MSLKDLSVICFGEVLMDVLPTGVKPGGAPMNVATHLQNFNVESGILSRIGNDKNGELLIDFLKSRNVTTDLIQIDQSRDTGVVRVNIDKNDDPVYTIVEKVAWDFIDDSFLKEEVDPKYIVHGSLACRSVESNRSLNKLINETNAKVVFDINVRSPYYSKSIIDELLRTAHIVKMNEEEFKMIKDWFYIKNPGEKGDFKALKALYPNIETMIVTKGGKGSLGWSRGKTESIKASPISVKDTIGSGDAFLGAFICKLDQGASLIDCLKFASATGAYVATQEGANPEYSEKEILPLIPKS
ncbi:MAG: carbohydrate kinase [Bacteroidota bacterium]